MSLQIKSQMIAFCGNIGMFLPSASMYGAMMHGDDWLTATDVYKFSGACIIGTVLIVMLATPVGLLII